MKIPPSAMPVVLLLRKHVPRPETLPRYVKDMGLRWDESCLCAGCPGLMLRAHDVFSYTVSEFWAFVAFWDSLRAAEPAVDAIWGKSTPATPVRK